MPPPASRSWPLGSKRKVRAQLDHSRAVDIAYSPGGAEARGLDTRCWVRPVWVVKYIQKFALKIEPNFLPNGNHLGDRQIVIPEMRTIEPYLTAQRSWGDILANIGEVTVAHTRSRG